MDPIYRVKDFKMRILFALGVLILLSNNLTAQCPIVDFTAPSAGCINQNLSLQNITTGADLYEWDFCSGELALAPNVTMAASSNLLFRTRSLRIVNNSNQWYGFTIDQANSPYRLIRFDFGNSLTNTPAIVDLGNPGNSLNSAFDLQMYKEGTNWFALITNGGSNSLVRLNFGSDLESTPVAQNLGSFGALNVPLGIFLVVENGLITAFVTNSGATSEIVRLDFGNSILNTPSINSFAVPGGSALRGLSIIKECDRWFGLVSSYGNGKVFWIDFTNGLYQSPQTGEITFFTSFNFPTNIVMALDGAEYYAFIQSALGVQYRLSFGASVVDKTGNGVSLGNFGVSNENSALELVKVDSDWIGFSIDLTNRRLVRQVFPTECTASPATFQGQHPMGVRYSTGGIKNITLRAVSSSGAISSQSKPLTISTDLAPDINFTSTHVCANHDVTFAPINISGDITTYSWSFGDSNTSSQAHPTNVYNSAGEYLSTLTVTATNGCQNFAQEPVIIYNQPTADFSLPAASPFCTNQQYNFSNTSIFDAASNPTWEWSLNGVVVASTLDLLTQFSTDQPQAIKLKSSIPGCESEMIKDINSVQPGPLTDFTFSTSCEEVAVSFMNTTTGAVVDYAWDFGDGNSSTQQNAVNTFENAGLYQVTLNTTNLSGCQNFISKEVMVYSKPQPNFSLDLPPFSCVGSLSQFNDLTPSLTDSNITSWSWSFGDAANGTSTQKNPSYIYNTAANYNVSLLVTSNFGCSNSIEKTITISPSPVAEFTADPSCLNKPTKFTDASGSDVKAWLWSINNSSYNTQHPTHTFSTTGTQTVMLTVTGNNNCVSQTTKTVSVPVPVIVDFTSTSTCAGTTAVFHEINVGGVDPALAWNWNFAGQSNASTSPAQHVFPNTGNFPVTLTSTRQSGCSYSITKSIPISQPPTPSFTVSTEAGASPLTVGFTNTSTLATSFLWKFNDPANSTSAEYSPAFVFNQLGSYVVELIASNAVGCSDSFTKTIQVVVPEINARLSDFILSSTPDGGKKATVTIENKSNITLVNPEVFIDLAGNALIREKLSGSILPGQSITRILTVDIIPRDLTYACAEVKVLRDSYQFDNRACLNLTTEPTYLQPYPNPAQSHLFLDWINENQESLQVVIYNSSGQIAMNQKYNLLPGLNQVLVDVNDLATGIYFVSYSDGKIIQSFRFSIAR